MSEYESLRNDLDGIAKALDHYSATAIRNLLEQSTQIDRLWADNAELRDELHAVANRLEALEQANSLPLRDYETGDPISVDIEGVELDV